MDVQGFFEVFADFYTGLFNLLASINIVAFGVQVPYLFLIGSIIIISMIVSYFWKGVRG